MGAPETGEGTELAGRWITIQPGLPSDLTNFLEVIQGLLEALLVILNVVLAILQVVKAFLVGLLNPLVAIIEAIIAEIEGLLQDIRQIGIYVNGDWELIQGPQFENILGGYQAYERRMIGRLVDRSDPSRPNFSSRVGVFALFTYISVDTSGIMALVKAITKLLAFFGKGVPSRSYTTPTGLRVSYGIDGQGLYAFGTMSRVVQQGDVPNQANLQWQMAPPPSGTQVRFPSLAPKGFLVEVSTVREGLLVAYDVPISNSQTGTRIYGLARDFKTGLPFRLYGGTYMLDVGNFSGRTWPTGDNTDTQSRLYAFKDAASTTPIPIELLKTTDTPPKFLLQRTFFVKAGFFNTVGPGQGFATLLNADDMPYDATFTKDGEEIVADPEDNPATTVFVRISAVTEDIADAVDVENDARSGPLGSSLAYWTVGSAEELTADVQASGSGWIYPRGDFNTGSKTEPSFPLTVTFPATTTKEYLDTVAVALAVMILSRSDVGLVTVNGEALTEEPPSVATVADAQAALTAAQALLEAEQQSRPQAESRESLLAEGFPEDQVDAVLAQQAEQLAGATATWERNVAAAEQAVRDAEAALAAAEAAAIIPFQVGKGRLATGLEDLARYLVPMLIGNNRERYFARDFTPPTKFRARLLRSCRAVANDLYARSGPLGDIEAVAVEAGALLMTTTWDDMFPGQFQTALAQMTILESLQDQTTGYGLGLNPMSLGAYGLPAKTILWQSTVARTPGFLEVETERTFNWMGRGSVDYSPVVYDPAAVTSGYGMAYCRNAFFQVDGLYAAAASVLNIAAAPMTLPSAATGSWIAIRLFPQGLPAVEQALAQIVAFVRAIAEGLQGVVDIIIAYIEFLEARIREFQSLINRILGLLNYLIDFELPAMSALIVTGNGTDGILQELVLAENKPQDATTAYGGGVVVMAGGLPSLLLDILTAFFPEQE